MLILMALQMAFSANARMPLAVGPTASIEATTRAAHRCGAKDLRFDPLDEHRAMLLIGEHETPTVICCTTRWMRAHRETMRYEPVMGGDGKPSA